MAPHAVRICEGDPAVAFAAALSFFHLKHLYPVCAEFGLERRGVAERTSCKPGVRGMAEKDVFQKSHAAFKKYRGVSFSFFLRGGAVNGRKGGRKGVMRHFFFHCRPVYKAESVQGQFILRKILRPPLHAKARGDIPESILGIKTYVTEG